jgi:ribosomal protein L7Ae-like RNA K-turn-binding protein
MLPGAGYCKEQSVQVVYAMNRYRLGKVCLRKVPVSCIGILNYQGSDVSYR